MKRCPACDRTYTDETLSFCLEDGSVLSASYDPDETLQISAPRDTDSILTKVSYPQAKPVNPTEPIMPTMLSPQMPANYSEKAQYQKEGPGSNKLLLAVGLLGCLVVALTGIIVWISVQRAPVNNGNAAQNLNNSRTDSNSSTRNDKKNDTGFGPVDDHASLNGENLTYYPGTSPEQCQADCAKNEKCKGFTFIRAGAYNPNDSAMCYQASVVTSSTSHACCISAVKR